jgi:hypothetical protein
LPPKHLFLVFLDFREYCIPAGTNELLIIDIIMGLELVEFQSMEQTVLILTPLHEISHDTFSNKSSDNRSQKGHGNSRCWNG